MTTTLIERATDKEDAPTISGHQAPRAITASAPRTDVGEAQAAAAVAALLTTIALLIVGIVVTASMTLRAPLLEGVAMTAALASTPFVVAAIVYARQRLVSIAADRLR